MRRILATSAALALTLSACATIDRTVDATANCEARSMAVFFDTGSSKLDTNARTAIANIAAAYDQCDLYRIDVAGYADSVGNSESNLQLSDARADSVYAALTARGVTADRVRIVPLGERTIPNTENPDQWERRAVVTLTP